jgi:hypothetical protein
MWCLSLSAVSAAFCHSRTSTYKSYLPRIGERDAARREAREAVHAHGVDPVVGSVDGHRSRITVPGPHDTSGPLDRPVGRVELGDERALFPELVMVKVPMARLVV